ncbi:hypothetical protein, partial [Enterococcus faecalis]|uniref:hypothetical protein n=1 Tax=Enterococcus faecalis TaxID=1351 RepID=UPI003984EA49
IPHLSVIHSQLQYNEKIEIIKCFAHTKFFSPNIAGFFPRKRLCYNGRQENFGSNRGEKK